MAEVEDGRELLLLPQLSESPQEITFGADGNDGTRLFVFYRDGEGRVWNSETGEEIGILTTRIDVAAFARASGRVATLSSDRIAQIWDVKSRGPSNNRDTASTAAVGSLIRRNVEEVLKLRGHATFVENVVVSEDGRLAATSSQDGAVKVWLADEGRDLLQRGNDDWFIAAAFSPDGKRLATGHWGRDARIWDVESGRALQTLRGHLQQIRAIAWSRDGKLAGTRFDIRGVIQLPRSYSPDDKALLSDAAGIKVARRCQRIHFLHGCMGNLLYRINVEDGTVVARYVIRYTDGSNDSREIVYGREVRDWLLRTDSKTVVDRAVIAWTGTNPLAERAGSSIRLFKTTWENPKPDLEIASIDLISTLAGAAPFVIAVTAE